MIIEGLVTTCAADGTPHLAAMGPRFVPGDESRFVLRPFASSRTYQHLRDHPQGVFHVTDDAALLVRVVIGALPELPPLRPAECVRGYVLQDCCRWYEFVVVDIDDRHERVEMRAEVRHRGRGRDFLGFNRARHALVEGAILASRLHLLPLEQVAAEYRRLRVIVDKTGDAQEQAAMALLEAQLERCRQGGAGPAEGG